MRALVKEKELQWRVHFRPYLDFPRPAYVASDAVAVCSQQESVGTVTLEAMASGCAIVGTENGGTGELLANGRGWTFPPGEASTLATQLMQIRNHPDTVEPRVKAGQEYIQGHRREAVLTLWQKLLQDRTTGAG